MTLCNNPTMHKPECECGRTKVLRLKFEARKLTLTASVPDQTDTETSLEYASANGSEESLNINFNADYLKDGIDNIAGDTVRFSVNGPLYPAILRSEGYEKPDYTYLIMPVQVK